MADAPAPGERDLASMLRSLTVERRPGVFAYVSVDRPDAELVAMAAAVVAESEGVTLVLPSDVAHGAGLTPVFEAAWLTLAVHSSLDAVGLTAAVSDALAAAGIPCNVLAGTYHDHLLVPAARADEAERLLTELSA
ncbi:MAG TPA: ACT domain-containing protein [Ilumatobacteraceae bacterium]|nr:ACT domain-containing protein [Ilumatobacteraceae bacterium]